MQQLLMNHLYLIQTDDQGKHYAEFAESAAWSMRSIFALDTLNGGCHVGDGRLGRRCWAPRVDDFDTRVFPAMMSFRTLLMSALVRSFTRRVYDFAPLKRCLYTPRETGSMGRYALPHQSGR